MSEDFLTKSYTRLRQALAARQDDTLPPASVLREADASLPQESDPDYLAPRGDAATLDHLLGTVVPALEGHNLSGRYFGFVTGSALHIAEAADNIVSALDQNVQVHLPDQTAGTAVEDAALRMLLALLSLGLPAEWGGRTFTTGATASNVLGLACGREAVVARRLRGDNVSRGTVGEIGLLAACQTAGIKEIQVLTSMGHSSLFKAASIVGLGRASVKELPFSKEEPWRLDLAAVESELARDGVASIIAVSAGEVNTGRFATNGRDDMIQLRNLADRHAAWIHVDGAFGILARTLPRTSEFAKLHNVVDGLELADSITVDGHKLLNVPYDAGVFFCRSASTLSQTFMNPNAAYLSSPGGCEIQSPLNIGIENSRRFRALPIYAVLLSHGREGIAEMQARIVRSTRKLAKFLRDSEDYEWLPNPAGDLEKTHIIVLFRARNDALNEVLVKRINETRRMYVSGTKWEGRSACRIAVSSWRVDEVEDVEIVAGVLEDMASSYR